MKDEFESGKPTPKVAFVSMNSPTYDDEVLTRHQIHTVNNEYQ